MNFEIKYGVLVKCTGNDETVIIPDGIVRIGERAFEECNTIKEITIPDSINKIDAYAFYGCVN